MLIVKEIPSMEYWSQVPRKWKKVYVEKSNDGKNPKIQLIHINREAWGKYSMFDIWTPFHTKATSFKHIRQESPIDSIIGLHRSLDSPDLRILSKHSLAISTRFRICLPLQRHFGTLIHSSSHIFFFTTRFYLFTKTFEMIQYIHSPSANGTVIFYLYRTFSFNESKR